MIGAYGWFGIGSVIVVVVFCTTFCACLSRYCDREDERIEMAWARVVARARARLEASIAWWWTASARDAAAVELVAMDRTRLEETIEFVASRRHGAVAAAAFATTRAAVRAAEEICAKKIVLVVVQPDPDDPPALACAFQTERTNE